MGSNIANLTVAFLCAITAVAMFSCDTESGALLLWNTYSYLGRFWGKLVNQLCLVITPKAVHLFICIHTYHIYFLLIFI